MTNPGRKLRGWEKDGKWFLSLFPIAKEGDKPRPVQRYDMQQAAIQEASKRGLDIEWQPQ
jgi:hypothetical protein